MRELLSSKDKRLLSIIEYCIENPVTTLGEISDSTGISIRTVSSSIPTLNSLISPCMIESDNSGIHLLIPANLSSRYIMKVFINNSFELSMIEAIFKSPNHSISEAAQKYFLSENTIRRALSNVNKVLKKHGFKIATQNLKFVGDIDAMHLFFLVFYSEKYVFVDESMTDSELRAIRYVIDNLNFIEEFTSTEQDYSRIISWMYVKTLTFKHYQVTPKHRFTFKITESIEAQSLFESAFNIPLTNELLSYWFSFVTHGFYVTSIDYALQMCAENKDWQILYNKIDTFLKKIVSKHNITLDNYDQLFIEIFNKLRYPNKYSFILYSRDSSFVKSISKDLPLFYLSVLESLQETFEGTLTLQDEQAMMYIVFTHWSHLFVSVNSSKRDIRVGVFTDGSLEHARMIGDVLNSHFKEGINTNILQVIYMEDLVHEMNKLDVLITNVPGLIHESCEIVCFSEYPTRTDWREIYAILNNLLFDYTTF